MISGGWPGSGSKGSVSIGRRGSNLHPMVSSVKAPDMQYPNMIDEIRNHNVISYLPHTGLSILIGDDIVITWKAEGKDTGYTFSCYEVSLAPNRGIPIHKHPYAEFFYVIKGVVDFQRCNDSNELEWIKGGPGTTVLAPPNAPHAFFNSSDELVRFVATSTYNHELMIKESETPTGKLSEGYPHPTPEGFERLSKSQENNQVYYLRNKATLMSTT